MLGVDPNELVVAGGFVACPLPGRLSEGIVGTLLPAVGIAAGGAGLLRSLGKAVAVAPGLGCAVPTPANAESGSWTAGPGDWGAAGCSDGLEDGNSGISSWSSDGTGVTVLGVATEVPGNWNSAGGVDAETPVPIASPPRPGGKAAGLVIPGPASDADGDEGTVNWGVDVAAGFAAAAAPVDGKVNCGVLGPPSVGSSCDANCTIEPARWLDVAGRVVGM